MMWREQLNTILSPSRTRKGELEHRKFYDCTAGRHVGELLCHQLIEAAKIRTLVWLIPKKEGILLQQQAEVSIGQNQTVRSIRNLEHDNYTFSWSQGSSQLT
jgi:hypothetical protein